MNAIMADKIKLEIITRSLFLFKNHGNQAQENHKVKAYTNLGNSCYAFYYKRSFCNKWNTEERKEKGQSSQIKKDKIEKSCRAVSAKNRAQHCSPKGRAYMKANRKTAYNRCYPVISGAA